MSEKKIYVNLFKRGQDDYYWEGGGYYFYLIPTRIEFQSQWIAYWVITFKDKAKYEARLNPDNKEQIKADVFWSIRERSWEKWVWYGWMLVDDLDKKTYRLSLRDNTFKWPEKNHDKTLVLKPAEYRERKATEENPEDPF